MVIVRGRDTAAAPDADGAADAEIVVTGTHIRGGIPSAPARTFSRRQIEEQGFRDLGELARSIPQNFSGGQNPGVAGGGNQGSGNENSSSSSALNLRGLGPAATLTLMNGHRLAYDTVGQGVDLSQIPVSAIDRIEIVTDGSSALYGADAIGGVANVKRVDGTTQVWRSAANGSASEMVTKSQDDVIDFQVDSDERVHFRTAAGLRSGNRAIDREGRRGFHFDDRFFPASSSRPFVPAPVSIDDFVVTLPRADVGSPIPRRSATEARRWKSSPLSMALQGARTWISVETGSLRPPRTLHVQSANGRETKCDDTLCTGRISSPWLTSAGAVRFFRREGWGNEATVIYEWMPGHSPKRLFETNDVLESCTPVDDGVICLREGSVTPRTIARIELPNGRGTVLFDPNPEFGGFPIGQVERLHWKNREGLAVLGDLVLPVGYRPGVRYPLIVVQYETRGFLRGGTGDEYPIQLYAAHGYAVLSFNRPPDIGLFGSARTIEEAERADLADFADHRSVQSALEAGIAIAVARGVADSERLGITGVSDGASTAQFALLNSNLFKAAAMSQCCWDPSMAWRVNEATMRYFRSIGYPGALSYDDPFWTPISIASNVDRVSIPMLFQIADREYIGALPALSALRERKAPSDLYVFPDETHIKWQPAHRLAIYDRSLAWFDFWLKGDRSPSTASIEESRHWNVLRDARSDRLAPSPASGQSTPPRR